MTRRPRFIAAALLLVALSPPAAQAITGPQFMLLHGINNDGTVWNNTAVKADILGRNPCVLLQPDTRWTDRVATQATVVRDQLNANDFQDGVLIGYSQGGLVAREYLRQNPGQTRVRSLITMGTPHRGAPILENLRAFPPLIFPIAFVVADAALVNFGYLQEASLPDGAPTFSIHWNSSNHPGEAVAIAHAVLTGLYFGRLKPTRDAPSSIDQTPGSPFLTTLNTSTTYQSGVRRAAIQGVEAWPELWFLGASATGISDQDIITYVNYIEHYAIGQALNAVIGGSLAGFAAYYSCYRIVNSAPYKFREIVGESANLPYDDRSDAIVPSISQVMPDAEPDDGPAPLLYRADLSNHLDHMNHPNVISAMRSALSTFGDTGPAVPGAPANVRASDAAGPIVTVDWDDVTREQNYLVYRDDAWIATLPANATHYDDNAACMSHTYRVDASNCAGTTTGGSDTGSRTAVPPPVPAGLAATDCGTQAFVRVTWGDVTGEDGYRVFRAGLQIAQVGANVTQYDDATGTPLQAYTYTVRSFRNCDGMSAPSNGDPGCRAVPPPTWTLLELMGSTITDHTAVYDDRDARMLTFGGREFGAPTDRVFELTPDPNVDWTWLWTTSNPPGPPSPREHPGVVYSPASDKLVTFGGVGPSWNGDLWQLDLTVPFSSGPRWYKYNVTAGAPVYEGTTKAVYDPVADRMIVVSPYEGVYAFSIGTSTWSCLYNGSLYPTYIGDVGFQCVYDAVGDRLLVYGGTAGNGSYHNVVYAMPLRGTATWSPFATSSFGQVSHGSMTWDPEGERVLLYGGMIGSYINPNVWSLSVTGTPTWTQLATAGGSPGGRWKHAAAYDWHEDRLVISGGYGEFGGYPMQDSWALTFPDVTAPAAAPELYVDALSTNQMLLMWSNSGDDGMHGVAKTNDVRMALWPLNETNFYNAGSIGNGPPLAPGTGEEKWISGLQPCTKYYFAMKVVDEAGNASPVKTFGPIRTMCSPGGGYASSEAAHDVEGGVPPEMEFARPQPNPASNSTLLEFGVPADRAGARFEVGVFDLAGRLIRSLARGSANPGRFTVRWDLDDQAGVRVKAGVYYVRFALGDKTLVRRVAAIR